MKMKRMSGRASMAEARAQGGYTAMADLEAARLEDDEETVSQWR